MLQLLSILLCVPTELENNTKFVWLNPDLIVNELKSSGMYYIPGSTTIFTVEECFF